MGWIILLLGINLIKQIMRQYNKNKGDYQSLQHSSLVRTAQTPFEIKEMTPIFATAQITSIIALFQHITLSFIVFYSPYPIQFNNKILTIMNSSVWVQVSVNIGQRCLKIEIQRDQSIEEVVSKFITHNKLSVKYQPIISNMIKEEIRRRMAAQNSQKSMPNEVESVQSSMSSGLGEPLCNQSFSPSFPLKQSALLTQVLKIQTETNRKKAERLSELRQTSQNKNSMIITEASVDEGRQQRPSFKKFQVVKPSHKFPAETPKMFADTSRQSSSQTFNMKTESDNNCSQYRGDDQQQSQSQSRSNIFSAKESRQNMIDETQKEISNEITSDIAELKQLLSYNQANVSEKYQEEESLWGNTKNEESRDMKRLKTETPQNIYEKWRKLDQEKKLKSQSRSKDFKLQPKSKSPLTKRQDTFFYNKGKSFLQQKKKKVDSKFNQIYPFRTTKTPLNSKTGIQTTNRLFKESKEYFSKKMVKPKHIDLDLSLKADPIREKVRKRDKEHDEILSQLIHEGRLKSPATIQYKEKSPFRKTIVFN